MTFATRSVSAFAVCLLAIGCGQEQIGDHPTERVTGTVTHDGQPLAGATVNFHNEDPSKPAAYGMTGEDGTFKLSTYGQDDGAVVGSYKVTVKKFAGGGEEVTDPAVGAKIKPESEIPTKYMDPQKSGLTARIEEGKTNEVNLTLD